MNILFLNEYANPHFVSGAEQSTEALAEALNKKNKVFVLSPNLGNKPKSKTVKHLKFPFLKKIKPRKTLTPLWFNNPIFWLYAAYYIKKTIKNKKIDLIHVHGKYILPSAIIAGKITKTPVIITVRDFKFLCPLALCYTSQQKKCSLIHYIAKEIPQYLDKYTQNTILKPLIALRLVLAKLGQNDLKWFLKQVNQVVAVSPQLAEIYKNASVKNTISIYNLPPKENKRKFKPNKQSIILSIGKLSYGKGTDIILKTAQILQPKSPQIKFVFAGSKNISLKQKFPSNCQYLGKLEHSRVLKFYQQADIFIILSRWPEPLSRAGLEALSFGLPIIASDRGGNQELVKDNGFLVDLNKSEDIAKSIQKALNNLQNFSNQSRKLFKQRFSRSAILEKHRKLYKSLI